MKRAILTGIDTHPANSLALALRSVGFDVAMLSDRAMNDLKKLGYTGGVRHEMLSNMGYRGLTVPLVELSALDGANLFVDIKKGDLDSFLEIRPEFRGKVLVNLINGGGDDYIQYGYHYPTITNNKLVEGNVFYWWPPFDNVHNLQPRVPRETWDPPMTLLHNAYKWGFGLLLDETIEKTGLRVYGSYGSPMGTIPNDKIGERLSASLCFVHPKASDAPGYALYEAFATATPIVATALLVERMRFQDLFEDEKTCLLWAKTAYKVEDGRIKEFIDASRETMIAEIVACVERLKDPKLNAEIGMAGYERWKELTDWTDEKKNKLATWLRVLQIL